MKLEWITCKGKRILCADYSNLTDQEMLEQLEFGSKLMLEEKEPFLYFGNFLNTTLTTEFMHMAHKYGKLTNKKVERMAVIGLTSEVRAILLSTYNMVTGSKIEVFNTKEEALEYLVK